MMKRRGGVEGTFRQSRARARRASTDPAEPMTASADITLLRFPGRTSGLGGVPRDDAGSVPNVSILRLPAL